MERARDLACLTPAESWTPRYFSLRLLLFYRGRIITVSPYRDFSSAENHGLSATEPAFFSVSGKSETRVPRRRE